jgi:predicted transcriptional regulator
MRKTFTLQMRGDTRSALDAIAASKEWTTGHLIQHILDDYIAKQTKKGAR